MKTLIVLLFVIVAIHAKLTPSICRPVTYERRQGVAKNFCNPGFEKINNTCYSLCEKDFEAFGEICRRTCPVNFCSEGGSCIKPASIDTGLGYYGWEEKLCNSTHPEGCVQLGNYFCPKCADGYKVESLCKCTPLCPDGFKDNGKSCAKPIIQRTVQNMTCASNMVEIGDLCYSPCKEGYSAEGTICVYKCKNDYKQCGDLCIDSSMECLDSVIEMYESSVTSDLKKRTISSMSEEINLRGSVEAQKIHVEACL